MSEFTVGVEEEYQLVDPETGQLRSGADSALAADWTGELKPEIQLSQVEIGTEPRSTAAGVADELARLRLQAATAAGAAGLSIVAAGVHPFARWQEQLPSPGERYDRIRERFGRVVRTEHIFGMHVHVAIPEGVQRTPVLNRARWFLPQLLALSGSSPLYEGEDTGFSSYRTVLAQRLAHSGPPPEFPSDDEYSAFLRALARADALEDEFSIYWSIRLHPSYPTVEFRGADVCPRIEEAAAVAAFIRALVAGFFEGVLPEPPGRSLAATARDALLAANEWSAARYGLEAVMVFPEHADGREPIRDAIRRLRDAVAPVAEKLGDAEALQGIDRILERGNAADRIRSLHERGRSCAEIVRCLLEDTQRGTGLDRRRAPRDPCCGDGSGGAAESDREKALAGGGHPGAGGAARSVGP